MRAISTPGQVRKSNRSKCPGRGLPARAAGRLKRLHERVLEIVDVGKIFLPIIFCFRKHLVLDEIEHDFAKIAAPANPPGVQDGLRQWAELVQRIDPEAFQQFGAADMARAIRPGGFLLAQLFDCLVKAQPDEIVSPAVKSTVFPADKRDDFIEIRLLHLSAAGWSRGQSGAIFDIRSGRCLLVSQYYLEKSRGGVTFIAKMIASTQTNHPLSGNGNGGISKSLSPIDVATAKLKAAGLRITQPRLAILAALTNRAKPTSIEHLHETVGAENCDLVTVYRCMAAFEEIGLVRRAFFHNGTALYEINLGQPHRYHVVCKATDEVQELDTETSEELRRAIEVVQEKLRAKGYTEVSHIVEFFGTLPTSTRSPGAMPVLR